MVKRVASLLFGIFLLSATMAAVPATATHGTTESRTYTGGVAPFVWSAECGSDHGYDGVWFCGIEDPAPTKVTIQIGDLTGLKVGAAVVFTDADRHVLDIGYLCGSNTLSVPAGTADVLVDINPYHGQRYGTGCSAGTEGVVTATWHAT